MDNTIFKNSVVREYIQLQYEIRYHDDPKNYNKLIERLHELKDYPEVKEYLNKYYFYEKIHHPRKNHKLFLDKKSHNNRVATI